MAFGHNFLLLGRCPAVALLSGEDASLRPLPPPPHPTPPILALFCLFLISIADLSHAGAESL